MQERKFRIQDVDSFPALGITNSILISEVSTLTSLRKVYMYHLGQLFDTRNSESVYNDESYNPPHTSLTEWIVYQTFSDNYSHRPAHICHIQSYNDIYIHLHKSPTTDNINHG